MEMMVIAIWERVGEAVPEISTRPRSREETAQENETNPEGVDGGRRALRRSQPE